MFWKYQDVAIVHFENVSVSCQKVNINSQQDHTILDREERERERGEREREREREIEKREREREKRETER